jgi:lipid-A-disaccharide synthase
MTPQRFMLVAGEPSGDMLAAELVAELRAAVQRRPTYSANVQPLEADLAPRFFGAGGPRMAAAGVELAFDMMRQSVIGLPGPKDYLRFRSQLNQLVALACEREPHAIICVDFPLFNAFLATAIKKRVRGRRGPFNNWEPKIIKYISPQVWVSRESRVYKIERDFDLVLSIFPFEKDWYAKRVPKLPVEFIGHPMLDRYANARQEAPTTHSADSPRLVLLPGSRRAELRRHLPPMLGALALLRRRFPALIATMILPSEALVEQARAAGVAAAGVDIRFGGLAESLAKADVAISKTGTITMECAFFGVPTVAFYKASWVTYEIGKRLVKVDSITMPNLLAKKQIFPEFVQHDVTPENLANTALEFLCDGNRRESVKAALKEVIASLGGPGASRRAAEAILKLIRG